MRNYQYHPDPEIDEEVKQEAAEAARADLAAGLPASACPNCGHSHNRGYIDGVSAYRCLNCGTVSSPK